jgi:hypothetical protein
MSSTTGSATADRRRAEILHRLLHRSVVLNIRGRSYRLQDLEKLPI